VTVPVNSTMPGSYTLHPGDLSLVGLDAPADATLTVAAVVGTPMLDGSIAGGVVLLVLLTAGGVYFARRRIRAD
jgi:hypothetical protein